MVGLDGLRQRLAARGQLVELGTRRARSQHRLRPRQPVSHRAGYAGGVQRSASVQGDDVAGRANSIARDASGVSTLKARLLAMPKPKSSG